jgi:UDP-glucose 4-epimerase
VNTSQSSGDKPVLVTGGAGFIGSHIVEALVDKGHRVRVLDDLSTGKLENLRSVAGRIDLIEGDIRDWKTVRRAVAGVQTVFHEAAMVSVPLSVSHPIKNNAINVSGTLNLLEAARQAGVARFVYASSAAVYGEAGGLPKVETMPVAPISPYGLSKRIGEQYAQLYWRVHGLETVGLRYFNVYGPRQDPSSPYSGVISIFLDRLRTGERPTVYGDGKQTRDFVFVSDVVDANLRSAMAPAAEAAGQVFNVSTERSTSIIQLWESLASLAGSQIAPVFAAERPGDVRHSRASYARALAAIGYEPRITLTDGLRRTLAWSRDTDVRR